MATGFLILTLYGLCIILVLALVGTAGMLYFMGRREETKQNSEAAALQPQQGQPDAPPADG